MDVHVRPIDSGRDLKRFIDFPYALYKDYPYWIAPLRKDQTAVLNRKKNAFFDHGQIQPFIAENGEGRIVGRIAAIVNGMHLRKYRDGTGFFGFFESEEDSKISERLFETAADWLKTQGLRSMRGPTNPSLNDTCGLLVDGFDREPAILMPYNPPYYEDRLLRNGFERSATMWAYYIHKKYAKIDRLKRGVEIIYKRNPGLRLRTIDMSRFGEEAETILNIYNDAWADNWGHVPMTEREFEQLGKEFKQIVDPNIVYVLELNTKPIAFSLNLPDLNEILIHNPDGRLFPTGLIRILARAKLGGIKNVRTPLMGIMREHQGKGFDAVLNLAIIEDGPRNGYVGSEMSWILDSNKKLINALESFGGVKDKQYAMFEKTIA